MLQNIKDLIKLDIKLFIIIILVGIIYFLFQNPTVEKIKVPVEVIVEIPAKKGNIKIDSIPVPYKVSIENPLNKELEIKYNTANDSIKKLLFMMAVAEKEYNITFKDSLQNINVFSKIVNGELKDQFVDYEIFPTKEKIKTEVEIRIPKYNKLYYGLEISNPISFNLKPTITGGLLLKNKKDNIWKLSINSNEEISLGYYIGF